jgi:hypothetical protein
VYTLGDTYQLSPDEVRSYCEARGIAVSSTPLQYAPARHIWAAHTGLFSKDGWAKYGGIRAKDNADFNPEWDEEVQQLIDSIKQMMEVSQ